MWEAQLCERGGAGWRRPSVGGPAVCAWGCRGGGGPVWEAQLCAPGGAGWPFLLFLVALGVELGYLFDFFLVS